MPIILLPDKGVWLEANAASRKVILPMVMEKQFGLLKEKCIPFVGDFHRRKKCENCGLLGHSRITCRNPPIICGNCGCVAHSNDVCQTSLMNCTKCNMEGHEEENCQNMTIRSSNGSTIAHGPDSDISSKRCRVMHCKRCGGTGQTIRTYLGRMHSNPTTKPISDINASSHVAAEQLSNINGDNEDIGFQL